MIFKDLRKHFNRQLGPKYEAEELEAVFYFIVNQIFKFNRITFLLNQETNADAECERQFDRAIEELKTGKPVQYIFSETLFYGLKLFLNPGVLIPRVETEELVHLILENIKKPGSSYKSILDIGTGSACIPVALSKHAENMEITALDVSAEALAVAEKNAALNNANINFVLADIFEYQTDQIFDIIVSNPPYIKENEKAGMEENVLNHEPHLALFVENDRPLIFYERIADFGRTNLAVNGMLFFEINSALGQEMTNMLSEKGYSNISVFKDMQGMDRMISCQYKFSS